MDATDGVRKNTTRGGRVSESSAKATSSDPPRIRSCRRWKHRRPRRERDRPARHHPSDGADRRGRRRIPEETRVASAQDPDTARSASHRKDGTNANATVCNRGATVMQGIIGARLDRKEQHEGDLEGEQGPGRVGQRTPEYGARWYIPAHGAKPRGTTSHRYGKNGGSGNGDVGTVADRWKRRVRGGNDYGDVERLRAGGILRGVRRTMRGNRHPREQQRTRSAMASLSGLTPPDEAEETHRTLRLAAGCNKPASPSSP